MPMTTETEHSHKKLTPLEWEEAVALWKSGSVTLVDLSARFGISKNALSDGFKKRGARKGEKAAEYAKKTEDSLKSEVALRAEEIKQFRKKYQGFGDFIMTLTMVELKRMAEERPRTPETQKRYMSSLKMGSDIYAKIRDQKFHLYDLYNVAEEDEDLPELAVATYTDEQLAAIRRMQEKSDDEVDTDALLKEAEDAFADMESELAGGVSG